MRDHIEKAFKERHPLLFTESMLNKHKSNGFNDQSSPFRGNQLLMCGEGWLPILDAFANSLEEIIFLQQPEGTAKENGDDKVDEELYLQIIYGTKSNGELVLKLEHSELDEYGWPARRRSSNGKSAF